MTFKVQTPKGEYKYKFVIINGGEKFLDKEKMKENLLLFDQIAKRNGLQYGMVYGTLLGAIREHDFIAHDEDVDLFVLSENRDTFKSMLFELRDNGFEVARWDRRDGLCSIIRNGEYMDIYFFEPLIPGFRATLGDPLPERYVTDLKPYEFQGIEILAAKDAEEAMLEHYGPNWRTPIQTNVNFSKNKLQLLRNRFQWWVYYNLPDFIFYPWIEKRARHKIEKYNYRAERLNKYLGREVLSMLPLDCYKAR